MSFRLEVSAPDPAAVEATLRKAVREAAVAGAQVVGAASQKIAPIAPPGEPGRGKLRDSMVVEATGEDTAAIEYRADYAAEVHETPDNYGPGESWQFLRRPMMDRKVQGEALAAMGARMREAWRRIARLPRRHRTRRV